MPATTPPFNQLFAFRVDLFSRAMKLIDIFVHFGESIYVPHSLVAATTMYLACADVLGEHLTKQGARMKPRISRATRFGGDFFKVHGLHGSASRTILLRFCDNYPRVLEGCVRRVALF